MEPISGKVHYTALHYTDIQHTALHYTALHCTTLNCTTLYRTTLHYTILHYTTLHYTTTHCTTLHCTGAAVDTGSRANTGHILLEALASYQTQLSLSSKCLYPPARLGSPGHSVERQRQLCLAALVEEGDRDEDWRLSFSGGYLGAEIDIGVLVLFAVPAQ